MVVTPVVLCCSVPSIGSLPSELLENICGFLDAGALCTACLVCRGFRGAASRCLHSVQLSVKTLQSEPNISFKNFPNLSRVTVVDVKQDDLRTLAQSPVAAAVTHLQAAEYLELVWHYDTGLSLLLLPKLFSLTVLKAGKAEKVQTPIQVRQPSPFPPTLRELCLEDPILVTEARTL